MPTTEERGNNEPGASNQEGKKSIAEVQVITLLGPFWLSFKISAKS